MLFIGAELMYIRAWLAVIRKMVPLIGESFFRSLLFKIFGNISKLVRIFAGPELAKSASLTGACTVVQRSMLYKGHQSGNFASK